MKKRLKKFGRKMLEVLAKGELICFFIVLIISAVLYFCLDVDSKIVTFIDFSVLSAILLSVPVTACSNILKKHIMSRLEDGKKLTEDYDRLMKKYIDADWLSFQSGIDGKTHKLPEIVEAFPLDGKTIVINDRTDEYDPPEYVKEHFDEIMKAHARSDVYNQQNIRVDDWSADENRFTMKTSRTTYFNSLATNRAMDFCWGGIFTVRELCDPGPFLTPLKDSRLSNHLGFNGFVISSDGFVPLVKRDGRLSIGKRTYGPSISASLKTKYALGNDKVMTVGGLYHAIYHEILDEMGVSLDHLACCADAPGKKALIIAAYREFIEGGKPQLVIAAKTDLKWEDIESGFKEKNKSGNPGLHVTDGRRLIRVPVSDMHERNIFRDDEGKYVFRHDGTDCVLTPSAAATVVIFGRYMEENTKPFYPEIS